MSRKTHVAKGRAARDRRYIAAVRRQAAAYEKSPVATPHGQVWYVEPQEFLRRGDELDRVLRGELS